MVPINAEKAEKMRIKASRVKQLIRLKVQASDRAPYLRGLISAMNNRVVGAPVLRRRPIPLIQPIKKLGWRKRIQSARQRQIPVSRIIRHRRVVTFDFTLHGKIAEQRGREIAAMMRDCDGSRCSAFEF